MIFICDVVVFQSTVHVGEFIPTSLHNNIISFLDRDTRIYKILWEDRVANGLVRAFLVDVLSEFMKHLRQPQFHLNERVFVWPIPLFCFQLRFCLALLCSIPTVAIHSKKEHTILQSRKRGFQILNFCTHVLISFTLLNICIFELPYGPRHTKTAGYLRKSKAHRS